MNECMNECITNEKETNHLAFNSMEKISANIQRQRIEINKNDIQLKDNFYIKRKRRPFLFVYKRIVNNENDKN